LIESAHNGLSPREAFSGEKRNPDLSIQDEKKRFGSLFIVFMEIQPVIG
jgi:hypothetical protein